MKWDDLKVFLVVARRTKLADASIELKMDVTTISRRIKRLEDDLGHTLFERLRSGHHLTSHGDSLLVIAEDVEANVDRVKMSQSKAMHKPSGTIRVSVAEGFGAEILAPLLREFRENYPDIEIDLVSGSGFLSLSRREADIAIGLTRSKSKQIYSELLCRYRLHLYASSDYLNTHPQISQLADLHKHTLIDYVDDLIYSDTLRYFAEALPDHRPIIRSTSILAQRQMVLSGLGLAVLPDFLKTGEFVKILPNKISVERQFWFSMHRSVAPLAKVKAFHGFCKIRLQSDLLHP